MGVETTGFVFVKGLDTRVKKAERCDDTEIKIKGIQLGECYYIKPAIDFQHNPPDQLPAGEYTIAGKCIIPILTIGDRAGDIYFQVEGDDCWWRFDETYIFCYPEPEINPLDLKANWE